MTVYANMMNNVPQSRPIPGSGQVKNNAGGYIYDITPQQKLERFLLIGSESNTFYVSAQELTEQNASSIISYIKTDGLKVLNTITTFTHEHRAPKMDATLFVLALCCTHGNEFVKKTSYIAINIICKTATHLFTFLENVNKMRGWSRGLRTAVGNWYTTKDDNKLSYQLVKYRQRNGWTHRDALRLAHPKALTSTQNDLFKYATNKDVINNEIVFDTNFSGTTHIINAFERAQKTTNIDDLCELIQEHGLTWEMIPTQYLNNTEVLATLLVNMPTQALIRNLGRFSKNGMTEGNSLATQAIKLKLNKESIAKSKLHPLNLVNSMRTYAQGHGDKGNSSWPVNQSIVDSLNEAYYHALENVTPTNKNILVALDVSPSMSSEVANMGMSAAQIGAVLALTMLRTEPNVELIEFCTKIHPTTIGKRTSLDEVLKKVRYGNGTDCSQAFVHAVSTKNKYDAIVILTDNETWAGRRHGEVVLEEYRNKIHRDVKVIEIAMVANPHSTLPANDPNLLRIVGFDASCISLINEFIK